MSQLQLKSGRPDRLAAFILVAVGLIAYVNCLASEFVFDDLLLIDGRTLDFQSIDWFAPKIDLPIKGRPLVGLTFVANYALCGTQPSGYHLFNMLVHVACAVALFGTVRRATMHWNLRGGSGTTGFAFGCALIWMVHPLQTECVNYLSQRTESMAALFMLVALYCAIRSYEPRCRNRWIVAAGMASWASTLCKETAAVGPLLILLFDLTLSERSLRDIARDRWPVYAATLSSWIPLASLMYFLPRTATVGASGDVTMMQYALQQSILIIQYLRLVFWPDALVIDYGRPSAVNWHAALPAVVAVLSLLALVLAACRRFPVVGFLGLAAFLLLAPTSSIIPINSEVGAERRMYLPLASLVLLVSLVVRKLIGRCCSWFERHATFVAAERTRGTKWLPVRTVVQSALLVVTVLALGARTIQRNADYADPVKLWTQAIDAYPENSRAWSWLAFEYSRVDPATAERVTTAMASRWHGDWSVMFDVAEAYLCLHRNPAAARRCYRRVVEIDPSHATAKLRLVWLLAGCVEDDLRNGDEALAIAKRLQIEYPRASEILDALAIAQAECGEFEAAIASTESAIASAEAAGRSTDSLRQRVEQYRRGRPFRFNET